MVQLKFVDTEKGETRVLELPGLSMENVEKFDRDGTLQSPLPKAGVGLFVSLATRATAAKVILAALQQDYPEITLDQVRKAITTQNVVPALNWVMGVEEDTKGEAARP